MIWLIFATVLDMSLPEFQPETDLSGNYIVGTYDVSENGFVVEETNKDVSENIIEEASDGLSVEASKEVIKSMNLRAIETHTINASVKSGFRVNNNMIGAHSGDNLYYIYLTAGIEYTVSNTSGIYTAATLNKDQAVTKYAYSTITPESNIYLVKTNSSFYVTYTTGEPDPEPELSGNDPVDPSGNNPSDPTGNDPVDPSGNDPGGNDNPSVNVDLTVVENKLDKVIIILKSVLLTELVSFLFPVIKSCVNLLKGGKDV